MDYSRELGPLRWAADLVHDENTFREHRAISAAEVSFLVSSLVRRRGELSRRPVFSGMARTHEIFICFHFQFGDKKVASTG